MAAVSGGVGRVIANDTKTDLMSSSASDQNLDMDTMFV
jgi:hypothetical protein